MRQRPRTKPQARLRLQGSRAYKIRLFAALLLGVILSVWILRLTDFEGIRYIDGDSFVLRGKEIRLSGIDAPEYQQNCRDEHGKLYPCGQISAEVLREMLSSKTICESLGYDVYRRMLGLCLTENGESINKKMVRLGWAIAYRRFSPKYIADEDFAKAQKHGIWKGSFQRPEEYRRLSSQDKQRP